MYNLVWGAPALAAILCVGTYLTVGSRFFQLRMLPQALRAFFSQLRGKEKEDGISSFQALCTALAATVGTGNLAGVAGAIAIGGPGAVFWMWVCGFFGMVIKCAEATLAVRYRVKNAAGETVGGPMYMIAHGMGSRFRPLAAAYCLFGVVAAFGVGNATQINTLISGINESLPLFGMEPSRFGNLLWGVLLAALIGLMLLGGAQRIGRAAEFLVPFAAV